MLFDSMLQPIIAAAIQLDVLHGKAVAQASPLASDLGRVKDVIHAEVLKLRELMPVTVPRNKEVDANMSDQITERDRQAAKRLISKYDLHPSDEDKIAAMIAARIVDRDLVQFIDDFLKLERAARK